MDSARTVLRSHTKTFKHTLKSLLHTDPCTQLIYQSEHFKHYKRLLIADVFLKIQTIFQIKQIVSTSPMFSLTSVIGMQLCIFQKCCFFGGGHWRLYVHTSGCVCTLVVVFVHTSGCVCTQGVVCAHKGLCVHTSGCVCTQGVVCAH